ncbi:unnamed protein product, partial [Prorocentrum cordatum]
EGLSALASSIPPRSQLTMAKVIKATRIPRALKHKAGRRAAAISPDSEGERLMSIQELTDEDSEMEQNRDMPPDPWTDGALRGLQYEEEAMSEAEIELFYEGSFILVPAVRCWRRFVTKMPMCLRVCAATRPLAVAVPRAGRLAQIVDQEGCQHPQSAIWHGVNQYARYSKCRTCGAPLSMVRFTKGEIEENRQQRDLKKRAKQEQRVKKDELEEMVPGDRPPLHLARSAPADEEGSSGSAPRLKVKMPPMGVDWAPNHGGRGSGSASSGAPTARKAAPAKAPPGYSQAERDLELRAPPPKPAPTQRASDLEIMRQMMLEDRDVRNLQMENMIGAIRALTEGIEGKLDETDDH